VDAIAVSPDGQRLYVADNLHSEIVVVDTDSRDTVAKVPVQNGFGVCPVTLPDTSGPFANSIAIAPGGNFVYAGSSACGFGCAGTVSAISADSLSPTSIFTTSFVRGLAISPDGRRLYVAEGDAAEVLDAASLTVIKTLPILARHVAATYDGETVLFSSARDIALVDSTTFSNRAVIPIPLSQVFLSPSQPLAYAECEAGICVVDLESRSTVATIPLSPHFLAFGDIPTGCDGSEPSPAPSPSRAPPSPSEKPSATPREAQHGNQGCSIPTDGLAAHSLSCICGALFLYAIGRHMRRQT
jgi:YVTN family beta-propeller protein